MSSIEVKYGLIKITLSEKKEKRKIRKSANGTR